MFAFLRALNLQPIEWTQAVRRTRRAAPYVGEVLRAGIDQAAAVVVLLTPDDEARLKRKFQKSSDPAYEKELSGQARPNVIFEAGRAFGSHPNSTVLVQLGQVRPFSNTAGVHVVHLSNDPESRRDLANRLEAAGCAIDDSGSDWLREGDFSPR
jgi:predicted nucleotide-binding protein